MDNLALAANTMACDNERLAGVREPAMRRPGSRVEPMRRRGGREGGREGEEGERFI